MIHLKSLEIENFKGIERLTCDFDESEVVAGRNHSGKTSIPQAVHLVVHAFRIAQTSPGSLTLPGGGVSNFSL
jgi:predicted ATP-dependent endonuclease of OLD family